MLKEIRTAIKRQKAIGYPFQSAINFIQTDMLDNRGNAS